MINSGEYFYQVLEAAFLVADEGHLVTLGINPVFLDRLRLHLEKITLA
jgi:hypothetical protein